MGTGGQTKGAPTKCSAEINKIGFRGRDLRSAHRVGVLGDVDRHLLLRARERHHLGDGLHLVGPPRQALRRHPAYPAPLAKSRLPAVGGLCDNAFANRVRLKHSALAG